MSTCLCNFVKRIEEDPEFVKHYDTNPQAAMDEYRLTNEEKDAVISGDQEKIRKLMGDCEAAIIVIS